MTSGFEPYVGASYDQRHHEQLKRLKHLYSNVCLVTTLLFSYPHKPEIFSSDCSVHKIFSFVILFMRVPSMVFKNLNSVIFFLVIVQVGES